MAWHQVCKDSDVPLGDMKNYSIEDVDIDVYHLEDGWYATSDMCTHQDCSLSEGEIEGSEIVCRCHGGAFDIRTGVATRMPCAIPVETFAVRVRDGFVEVELD
ncbi:non-heme iron oxygenase ferredoxin subunit [Alicyclobacillus cycloheptanicus]|uniref:Nitrite reductase/ring-hydroxylating ferredoxin subunit n=1 Tax=Alicyclobacillus cycloheptanicus TaxID=1457 RepID=A0ABT9XL90_9BACL|nr:non-heme iron oxygenase ferredoxin subunit [Alicyclobacillus cycloheptanicus]MCL6443810.1 non-heme iron oxygenase ferredoxin subunit [Alicyclobacillus sp.]MDQ0191077.1 nitrite reductase/ring-hydroxylating ferredoxin subunit [Alicyclobacillus cycloheptanicus]WDM00870.1 non-heme iron oxygenase ferredoxin subunit [Alicyclobacillus cycloheptanicus]